MTMPEVLQVKSVRHYRAGYEIRRELWLSRFKEMPEGHTIEVVRAYTPSGDFIGDTKIAYSLCKLRGIKPEKARPEDSVCSIGFSERKQKWYGWSRRAIEGFGIGDMVKKGDCSASSGWTEEYLKEHPEDDRSLPIGFIAKTLEDAKRIAEAFAASVF